jgi:uncharacterized membrane protein
MIRILKKTPSTTIYWSLFIVLCFLAVIVLIGAWGFDTTESDVYFSWVDGARLLEQENPYARILQGDMRENQKYATYFPLFYLLSAASQLVGLRAYVDWIYTWRIVFLLSYIATGVVIFAYQVKAQRIMLAFVLSILWLFNTLVINSWYTNPFNFLPIFFLILSLYQLRRRPYLALFLFSVSLALKQIAIFLVPLYLIWLWHSNEQQPLKHTIIGAGIIFSLPLISSLPFLVWEAEGFVRSILFSVTRYSNFNTGLGRRLIGNGGIASRIPMILVLGMVYYLVWQKNLRPYTSAALSMFVFVALTPVLFPQYLIWVLALVPFTFGDIKEQNELLPLERARVNA